MNLNNLFSENFSLHFGPAKGSKCLLAVSGGIDSMTMLELFRQAGITAGVAHCNFTLRGNESDLDHELVKQYCTRYGIPFFEQHFDTLAFATKHKLSIQMAARKLRYTWFEQLANVHSYDFIATAHHQNDNAETILLNIVRGTGINGLAGIPLINGRIIRPLLFATKTELESYAAEHQVPYREDASNSENKYARNKIRNEILPALQNINPAIIAHINALGEYADIAYSLLKEQIQEIKATYTTPENDRFCINMKALIRHQHASFFVFELVRTFGFNATQVNDILVSFTHEHTGKLFYTHTHQLLIDRDLLVVSPLAEKEYRETSINVHSDMQLSAGKHQYALEYLDQKPAVFMPDHIYLDADTLTLPYTIRQWKQGDRFQPLGMSGMKKISDFLIDEKTNLIDKDEVFVLENNGTIAAILTRRISEQYKITSATKRILHLYEL